MLNQPEAVPISTIYDLVKNEVMRCGGADLSKDDIRSALYGLDQSGWVDAWEVGNRRLAYKVVTADREWRATFTYNQVPV